MDGLLLVLAPLARRAAVTTSSTAAELGLPALGALVFLVVLAAGIRCWVASSDVLAERVSRALLAWRGNHGCLNVGAAAQDPQASPPSG